MRQSIEQSLMHAYSQKPSRVFDGQGARACLELMYSFNAKSFPEVYKPKGDSRVTSLGEVG